MTKLQATIVKLQTQLDDPSLFTRDRKTFDATSAALTKAQTELETAEERWLELEILREEIS
jgi:ATP-binding cassette subfamily F protein uup